MSNDSTERPFDIGDRVRIDIPDETDPDFQFHGKNGEVISVNLDEVKPLTGNSLDDGFYSIELGFVGNVDIRCKNLLVPC